MLKGVPQIHIVILAHALRVEPIEAFAAHSGQPTHLLDRRLSAQCLQHPPFFDALQAPFQKIDLECLLADFSFQLGHAAVVRMPIPQTRKGVLSRMLEILPPAVQQVRINLARSRHCGNRSPTSNRRSAAI